MGVSFAKSVKFGAVRFNFSGSGIGISVGIPGLRIGTGPRGAYIGGGMCALPWPGIHQQIPSNTAIRPEPLKSRLEACCPDASASCFFRGHVEDYHV